MAQQAVEKVGFDKHSLARTGRMALYGGGTLQAPRVRRKSQKLTLLLSYIWPSSNDMVRLPRTAY